MGKKMSPLWAKAGFGVHPSRPCPKCRGKVAVTPVGKSRGLALGLLGGKTEMWAICQDCGKSNRI